MEVATSFLRDAETRHREGRTSEGRFLVVQGTLKRYLIPYFGRKEITLIQKKELMDYRKCLQDRFRGLCLLPQRTACPSSIGLASHP